MKGLSGLRTLLVIALLFTLSMTVNSFVLFEGESNHAVFTQLETKTNVQVIAVAVPVEEVSAIEIVGLSTQVSGTVITMIMVNADLEAGNLLFNNYGWIDIPHYLLE